MSELPANWPPPETPTPPGAPPKRKSTVIPALISVVCGFLLVIGSFFGYVATCAQGGRNPWNTFFAGLIPISIILLVVAAVWLVAAVIAAILRPRKRNP